MWVNRIRSEASSRPDFYAPRDLASVAVFGFVGDTHALGSRLLAEARDSAGCVGFAFRTVAVGFGETTDDGDLFAVDDDRRVAGEPAFRQATGEPVARAARVGLFGLLPAAGAARPSG